MLRIKFGEMLSDSNSLEGVAKQINNGAILIYPTDTVYGIGCNAEDARAVKKLRQIKGADHPFSIIAPSKAWIQENLKVNFPEFLEKLPGPLTLIMAKKGRLLDAAAAGFTLGVRIPDHPIMKLIEKAGAPFITTSANLSGRPAPASPPDIPRELERQVDFVIDGGTLPGKPSRIIDLTGREPVVLRE